MTSTDNDQEAISTVARRTLQLLTVLARDPTEPARRREHRWFISGSALARLATLLAAEMNAGEEDHDLLTLFARAVLETWLTGHSALVLGPTGITLLDQRARTLERLSEPGGSFGPNSDGVPPDGVTLDDLARLLDLEMYGVAEPPKAFQRHVASFYDEIDIRGAEGTLPLLDRPQAAHPPGPDTPGWTKTDVLRVSLWVILFLAHDHFEAAGQDLDADRAHELFQELRDGTAAFYRRRLA